jgi:hypothetical protein
MAYCIDMRRADDVHEILKGAKSGDVESLINLKAAKALGHTLPPARRLDFPDETSGRVTGLFFWSLDQDQARPYLRLLRFVLATSK